MAKQKKAEQPATDPKQLLQLIHARNDRESAKSLSSFLEYVQIDCRPVPMPFGQVAEPWQRERNEWIVPAFEFVSGLRPDYTGPKNFWLGYSKGQDKTSYIGRALSWCTSYSRVPLRAYCCAKDQGQANIIYDAMVKEANLNPWYAKHLEFKRNLIENTKSGAKVEILTSDGSGAHGKNPDILVYDEITHWQSRELYDALQSAKVKRGGHCISLILTNAGYLGSWQDDIRKVAREENGKAYHFFEQRAGQQLASWIDPKEIELEKKTISPWEARRLFSNEWLDPSLQGLKFLSPESVELCIGTPQKPPPNARVIISVDYGGVHDPTALGVLWWDGNRIHVVRLDRWRGSPTQEIQIADVEGWVNERIKEYPYHTLVFDKHQLISTCQKLEREGRNVVRFEYRGGKQNYVMALHLKNLIENQRIVFKEDAGICRGETFASELKRLIIKEMSYGFRFDHQLNSTDDLSVVIGMGALEAVANPPPSHFQVNTKSQPRPEKSNPKPLRNPVEHFKRRGWYGLK